MQGKTRKIDQIDKIIAPISFTPHEANGLSAYRLLFFGAILLIMSAINHNITVTTTM